MTTATEQTNAVSADELLTNVLIHGGGVGGGTALLIYSQSWYAEPLREHLSLSLLGLFFWLLTIGAFSWTMWHLVIPTFVTAER